MRYFLVALAAAFSAAAQTQTGTLVSHSVTTVTTIACPQVFRNDPQTTSLPATARMILLQGGYACSAVELSGPNNSTGAVTLTFPQSIQGTVGAQAVTLASGTDLGVTVGHRGVAALSAPTRVHNMWVNISFSGMGPGDPCPPVELARASGQPAQLALDVDARCAARTLRVARTDATVTIAELESRVVVDAGHIGVRCCSERGGKIEVTIRSSYRFTNERDELTLSNPAPNPDEILDPDDPQSGFRGDIRWALRTADEAELVLAVFDGAERVATSERRLIRRGSGVEAGVPLPLVPIGANTTSLTLRAIMTIRDRPPIESEVVRYNIASLVLDHIEVVQTVQTPSNSIPLVRGKPAMVRVFVRTRARTPETIDLRVALSGTDLGGARRVDDLASRSAPAAIPVSVNRGRSDDFQFRLPDSWFRLAQVELDAAFLVPKGFAFTKASRPRAKLRLEFRDFAGWTEPLRVGYQIFCSDGRCPDPSLVATAGDLVSRMLPMAPRHMVYFPLDQSRTNIAAANLPLEDPVLSLLTLADEYAELAAVLDTGSYDYLVTWADVGRADLVFRATTAWVQSDPLLNAKNLGNTLFRQVAGVADQGGPEIGADPVAFRILPFPTGLTPITSIGDVWIHASEYLQLTRTQPQRRSIALKDTPPAAGAETQAMLIRLRARRDGSLHAVSGAAQFPAPVAARASSAGEYCFEFRKGTDPLGSHCFNLNFGVTAETNADETVTSIVTAFPAGADSFRLRQRDIQLTEVKASVNAPTVEFVTPAMGDVWSGGGRRTIEWRATDADGDTLRYLLFYSPDGGNRWLPLSVLSTSTQFELDTTTLRGGADVLFRVIASDGFHSGVATAGPVDLRQTPRLEVTPASPEFRPTPLNSDSDLILTLSNTGDGPLTISNLRPDHAAVSTTTEALPIVLAASASRALTVRFSPGSEGELATALLIDSNDPAQPVLRVPLRGRGVGRGGAEIVVNPVSLDFGTIEAGRDRTLPLSIRNNGTASLRISSLTAPAAPFSMPGPATPLTLAPGQEQTLSVSYRPGSAGVHSGVLVIASDDPLRPRLEVTVRGAATSAGPVVPPDPPASGFAISAVSPSTVIAGDFGFTLTVDGRGFVRESVVRWNTVNRPTTFVSATRLTAQISRADISAADLIPVTVANPPPNPAISSAVNVRVEPAAAPAPVLSIQQIDTRLCPQVSAYVSLRQSNGVPANLLPPLLLDCNESGSPVRCSGNRVQEPVSAVIVIGTNGLNPLELEAAKAAARGFLERLGPEDRVGLVHVETVARQISTLTTNKAQIRAGLEAIREVGEGNALYDAVAVAASFLGQERGRRLGIFVIAHRENQGGTATESSSLASARAAGAPVFAVGHGPGLNAGSLGAYLAALAGETRGIRYAGTTASETTATGERVASILDSQWEVTYQAADTGARTLGIRLSGTTLSDSRNRPGCAP